MDIASLIGIVMGLVLFVLTVLIAIGFDMVQFGVMIDVASLLVVVGGGFASAMTTGPMSQFVGAMKAQKLVLSPPKLDAGATIASIVGLANTARKEGVLALEDSVQNMEDQFLKKGIMLIVDGTDPGLVKDIMETELAYIDDRHSGVSDVFGKLGMFFPAWGMIGTLIGLITMLQNLDDMAAIGPSMSIALITTLYGSLFANWWALPFQAKLETINKEEQLIKNVTLEGMLSIQAGENPRIIEEKLKSFLAPAIRATINTDGGGGGGE